MTRKSRVVQGALAVVGAAMLAVGVGLPAAVAAETDGALDGARIGYIQLGVAPAVADSLIEKLKGGAPLDSMLEDSVPTRTDSYIQVGDTAYANDGDQVTVRWYADGSPAVTAQQIPSTPTSAGGLQSIQGCSYYGGSGYSNADDCTVSGWWGTVQIAFLADYTNVQGHSDYIRDTYEGWQQCVWPTTCSAPYESQANYNEGSGPAFSRWNATVSSPGASWQVWMQINVGGDSAWSTSS